MRLVLVCLLTVGWILGQAQISRVEYFVDTDPGLGQATALSLSPGAEVSLDAVIPLATVSQGFHTLNIRAADRQGRWSLTYAYVFFNTALAPPDQALTAVEYFIDTDPGAGAATRVTIPPNQRDLTLPFRVDLAGVAPGAHTLYVRASDRGRSWSAATQHAFLVKPGGALENITALRYNFERPGFVSAVQTYSGFTPAPSVDLNFTADISQLPEDAEYTMNIWAVATNGMQSLAHSRKVKVCTTLPAKAKFDFIPMGTQVSFVDSSEYAARYRWTFGDGKTDTVSNPMHVYDQGGVYHVRLIVSNFCNADTLVKRIEIVTLSGIYPDKGGNAGSVVTTLNGSGFIDNTLVKLIRSGVEITGKFTQVDRAGTNLTTQFDLKDQPLGKWALVAVNGVQSDTLTNGFLVEPGTNNGIWIELIGRETVRTGRVQVLTLNYGNNGNNDVEGLPMWLVFPKGAMVDMGLSLDVRDDIIGNDTIPLFFTTVLPGEKDSVDVYGFIIPYIPAFNSNNINIRYSLSNQGDFPIRAWIGEAIYNSPRSWVWDNCIMQSFTSASFDVTGLECVSAAFELAQNTNDENSPYAICVRRVNECERNSGNCSLQGCDAPGLIRMFGSAAKALMSCASVQGSIDWIEDNSKAVLNYFVQLAANLTSCTSYLSKRAYTSLNVKSLTSYDPNAKVGPTGITSANHIRGNSPLHYTIFFENKDTAPVAAQEVLVLDTLDKDVYDLTSFQLGAIAFGDSSIVEVRDGRLHYSTQLDLRPHKDLIVRIDAKLDTASGVVFWRFLSLDPVSRELTDDPLLGFLPPNRRSPEGEGQVKFSIRSKSSLAEGAVIPNRSIIYFDTNEPIVTNTFVNTIDRQSPVSGVNNLPLTSRDSVFTVRWTGNDAGAGVRSYDVYAAVNEGPFRLWQYDVSATEATFVGRLDSSYQFYSVSRDYAGNIESAKTAGEAGIQIKHTVTAVEKPEGSLVFLTHPNPFHSETVVAFELTIAQRVTIVVRDLHGRVVATLADDVFYGAGRHRVVYHGATMPAAMYLCEMRLDERISVIKLLKY